MCVCVCVQRNSACFTWKGALEIQSLLLSLFLLLHPPHPPYFLSNTPHILQLHHFPCSETQDLPHLRGGPAQTRPGSKEALPQRRPCLRGSPAQRRPSSEEAWLRGGPAQRSYETQDLPGLRGGLAQRRPSSEEAWLRRGPQEAVRHKTCPTSEEDRLRGGPAQRRPTGLAPLQRRPTGSCEAKDLPHLREGPQEAVRPKIYPTSEKAHRKL